MKKLMAIVIGFVMIVTLATPVLACEVGLEGSSYYEEETGMEGYFTYDEAEESGPYNESDLCEVYIGNPDVAIMANEYGVEGACCIGDAYTESGEPDDFICEDEFNELCESLGVYPEDISGIGIDENDGTMWCQPVDIEYIEYYETPYGGDPTLRREYENYKIWQQQAFGEASGE